MTLCLNIFCYFLFSSIVENMQQQQPVRAFPVSSDVVVGRLQPTRSRGRPPKETKSSLNPEQEMIFTRLKSTATTAYRLTNNSKNATIEEIKNSAMEFDENMEAILTEIQSRINFITQTTNVKKDELFEIESSLQLNDTHRSMISSYRKMPVEELQHQLLALELHKKAIGCLIFIRENNDFSMELVGRALRDMQDELYSSRNDTSFLKSANDPMTQEIP